MELNARKPYGLLNCLSGTIVASFNLTTPKLVKNSPAPIGNSTTSNFKIKNELLENTLVPQAICILFSLYNLI